MFTAHNINCLQLFKYLRFDTAAAFIIIIFFYMYRISQLSKFPKRIKTCDGFKFGNNIFLRAAYMVIFTQKVSARSYFFLYVPILNSFRSKECLRLYTFKFENLGYWDLLKIYILMFVFLRSFTLKKIQ